MPSLMSEDDRNAKREELKSNWKIPSAAQFVSLFRIVFKLPEIEIEDLEEGLLDKSNVERKILIELFVALLRGINYKVKSENWEIYLKRLVQKKFVPEAGNSHPFPEPNYELFKKTDGLVSLDTTDSFLDDLSIQENSLDRLAGLQDQETSFWDLDSSSQADIILFLCYMRLDRSDAVEAMKNMDADVLRAQSLGCDNDGNKYWYFYGTRLYKEQPPPEKKFNVDDELKQQKNQPRRGRGRPRKITCKPRKSDGESDDHEDDGNQKKFMNTDEKSSWSVVCNTLDDWINFADKFKDSTSKCERSLFEVIQANFLPALNEIYQEKEKRLRQKIKELISLPMITKRETRSRHRTKCHNQESNGFDIVKESLKRDRAHRLEERNRRACEEPTKLSRRILKYYDDDNDEENPDVEMSEDCSDDTMHSSYKDEYVQDCQLLYSNGVDLKPALLKLVGEVKLSKEAWPFVNPVQKEEAPGYYEIISQPIDLSTITKKLLNHCYNSVNQLDADFRKIVSNSRLFNGEHSGQTKMAHNVYSMFLCGLNKIFEEHGMKGFEVAANREVNKVKNTSKRCHSKVRSKGRRNSEEGRKRKKKNSRIEALESLSREAELSVVKSNNVLKNLYTCAGSRRSNLKVVPIHSNPREVVERLTSDSSNQDNENESNNSSSLLGEENANSLEDFDVSDSFSGSNDYLVSHSNDDNSNESVFTNEDNFNNNCNLNGEEVSVFKETSHQQMRESDAHSPDCLRENDRKASNSSTEGLLHGMANILDECSNQSITNGDISFTREPLYSSGEVNTSPGGKSMQSHQSHSSDSGTPENTQKISPESSTYIQSSIVDKHVPFLQDGSGIQSGFTFPSNNNETSTVDASILGFSSFTSVSSRKSELSNQSQSKKITTSPSQCSSAATFTTHLSPNTSPKGVAPLPNPQPVLVNSTYDKVFTYQNPVQILKPEPNKFPTMKVSLPPSTGEILVVPDKTDPNKMTFHLLAQPHANPSQPIQSSMELRANTSPEIVRNEVTQSSGDKIYKDALSVVSPKRASPTLKISQYQSTSYGMSILSQPPVTSNFSTLLKPVAPFSNFTSSSNFPAMSAPPMPSFPSMSTPSASSFPSISAPLMSSFPSAPMSSMSNNFIPVSTNTISSSPNSFLPINTYSTIANKSDQQLIKPRPSNCIASTANQDFAMRSSSIYNCNTEKINIIPQTSSCFKTLNSTITSSVLSGNKTSRNTKPKLDASSKRGPTVAQKLSTPNNSSLYPSNIISNGNGQYEILLPAVDGSHQFSRFQTLDRQTNVLKTFPDGSSPPAIYASTYPNSLQNYGLSTTPHIVYAQVNPNQPSQFINIPSYMITSQNVFQHPSIMNAQSFQVPNRPVISMDLNDR